MDDSSFLPVDIAFSVFQFQISKSKVQMKIKVQK